MTSNEFFDNLRICDTFFNTWRLSFTRPEISMIAKRKEKKKRVGNCCCCPCIKINLTIPWIYSVYKAVREYK